MRKCKDLVPLLGPMLDGELPEDDRAWVEEHLAGCTACRDRQALIAAQGQALRDHYGKEALDFTGFTDKVMARVAADKGRAPVGVWGNELWQAHRSAFMATSGLAVAACLALAVLFTPPKAAEKPVMLAAASLPAPPAAPGVQVDEVDFGTHDGAVLQLPQQTTVIWMAEDE